MPARGRNSPARYALTNDERIDAVLSDLVQDYGQWAVDAIFSEDILAHIPVIRTAVAAAAAIQSVRDQILFRKLTACLTSLSEVPPEQRRNMVARLQSDPAYGRRVGEHLIELLDRMDSHRKPAMAGKVFAAYAQGKIELTLLQRLVDAIDRLPTHEIDTVRRFVNSSNSQPDRDKIAAESIQALTNAGLTRTTTGPLGGRISHNPNMTCSMFVELNLDG